MPHSTQTSVESNGTFDLTTDARPKSSHSDRTVQSSQSRVHARVPSNSFGIAVTSGPFRDERASLPSQRDSVLTAIRNSGPTTPVADAGTRAGGNNANAALIYRKAGDRSSMRSYSSNDVSRRGIAYHEEQVQNRDSGASSTKAKVPRQSPVIAELKTNVIVSQDSSIKFDRANVAFSRSKMNSHWSPTCPTTLRDDTRDQRRISWSKSITVRASLLEGASIPVTSSPFTRSRRKWDPQRIDATLA